LDNTPVDSRSEDVINTLLPEVRPYARTLVHKAAAAGITLKVISGLRSYAEQDKLYAQGRTDPGDIVTNAPAGYSNHNFGLAFDVGVFEGAEYIDESPKYKAAGAIGMSIGLTWGGTWTSIQDEPHFELRPLWAVNLSEGDMLAGLRERRANGSDYFA
jgi:peptidoglycan L-alanyl-D-glutamate endopeptidase CwlK